MLIWASFNERANEQIYFEIVILKTKRLQIPQKLVYEKFYVHEKNYVQEIAAVNLLKLYFLKNAKKRCKPNCDWINRI